MTRIAKAMFLVEVGGIRYGPYETREVAEMYAGRYPAGEATIEEFRNVLVTSQELTDEEYDQLLEGRALPGVAILPPDA